MSKIGWQYISKSNEEFALHCWENEGGSLRGGAQLQCNEHPSATAASHDRQKVDGPSPCHAANRGASLRRSKPAHWRLTRESPADSHRFAQRWLPRVRATRRSRHALERTPLGLLGRFSSARQCG